MSDTQGLFEDRPQTLVHPPTVFLIALTSGYILRLFFGGRLALPRAFAEGFGGLLILVAMAIFSAAIMAFAAGGETLKTTTPSQQLFTKGVYGFSRNPVYLAMMLFGVGFAITTSNIWIIVTSAIAGVLFHFFVIKPEERYLEDRFGEEFHAYKNSVRRWI